MGKPNRPLVRPTRRWEDNIKKDLEEVGKGVEWIDLVLDRDMWCAVMIAVMNFRVT